MKIDWDDTAVAEKPTKRIFRGTESLNHLAPFARPKFFDLYKKMRANTWQASEPAMGADRHDYWHRLTDAERHMFVTTFSYLSTSDLVIQRNLAVAVYNHITLPEAQLCLSEQIGQEALHSHAYQTCVEVIGLDEAEVYTLYERIPEVRQKVDLANKYTEKLSQKDISPKDLLKGLVFYYLAYEGGFFMCNFNPIFSLKRRNLVPGSIEQLTYIQRDESTHVALGTMIIRELMNEYPDAITEHTVVSIFNEALEAERIFSNYAIPDNVLGYNREDHLEYMGYLLNLRLRAIGLLPYFEASNQFTWLDEIAKTKKEVNFFEGKVTEYQSGALQW